VKLESAIIGRPQQIRRKPPLKRTPANEETCRNLLYCAITGRRCVKGANAVLARDLVCLASAYHEPRPSVSQNATAGPGLVAGSLLETI
jgi:hypothetical protein